jgi:hypothetical protein
MAVGDFLTLCGAAIIVFLGGRAVARQTWDAWLKPMVLRVWPARPPDIMSSVPSVTPSEALRPRTDASADGRTEIRTSVLKPATLDTVRSLRTHGFTRDEARAFLKTLSYSLGNDTWAKAQSVEDDEIITPYAGRVTKKEFYPDRPDLEYKPLSDSGA